MRGDLGINIGGGSVSSPRRLAPVHAFSSQSVAVPLRTGLVWGFSCQAVVLGCAESFLFGAGKPVFPLRESAADFAQIAPWGWRTLFSPPKYAMPRNFCSI